MPVRVDRFILVEVPEGWTLDWRDAEDIYPVRPPVRFADGQTATIPNGLGEIRMLPKVLKGAVDYWQRYFEKRST